MFGVDLAQTAPAEEPDRRRWGEPPKNGKARRKAKTGVVREHGVERSTIGRRQDAEVDREITETVLRIGERARGEAPDAGPGRMPEAVAIREDAVAPGPEDLRGDEIARDRA